MTDETKIVPAMRVGVSSEAGKKYLGSVVRQRVSRALDLPLDDVRVKMFDGTARIVTPTKIAHVLRETVEMVLRGDKLADAVRWRVGSDDQER